MKVLAIDQGTTSTKAHILFDDGRFVKNLGVVFERLEALEF